MPNACKKSTLWILIGLCALCRTACAPGSPTIQTEIITPPQALLAPCDKPEPGELRTNGDLARYTSALRYALDTCAARIDALNVFFDAGTDDDK